ncbi:MAG: NADH-quinone oxidoreductase subunit D [Deltaproteobacteria bacterium]|nr:NADH-quinone oxidoreductase subunit D [Deltaproteobacteria bacterium]
MVAAALRQGDKMIINMGPSHPATHGTVKFVLTLDGETVDDIDIHIGYLHRGFEKMSEQGTWQQVLPYTDRLNYVSPLCNNVGYVMAVEKLMGVQITPRCSYIRMLVCEISRVTDHLTALAAGALELGGFTPFLYGVEARETLYPIVEELCGARLTTSYTRIGGLRSDLPDGYGDHVIAAMDKVLSLLDKMDKLLTKNRIFYDRMIGTGQLSQQDAIACGVTGVMLRSAGVDWDLRKHQPYLHYNELDFDVILGHQGDNYDRYLCRFEEIHQCNKMIRQMLRQMPGGPVNVGDWQVVLPPKAAVYNSIEGMIAHFKLTIDGHQVPAGEAYQAVEGGNGEVGFYVVSQGNGRPYKVHVRAPCYYAMGVLKKLVVGGMLADIVPTFDTLNMIGGEVDR